jgi:hypothetical protein
LGVLVAAMVLTCLAWVYTRSDHTQRAYRVCRDTTDFPREVMPSTSTDMFFCLHDANYCSVRVQSPRAVWCLPWATACAAQASTAAWSRRSSASTISTTCGRRKSRG